MTTLLTPGRTRSAAARHRGAALSSPASVPPHASRRQVHQGPGPGLGAQPLLLSGHDSDQGCELDRALPRQECDASGAADLSIMMARRLARAASRAGSNSPTASGSTAITSPRSMACCRRTRFAVEAYVHFVAEKTLLEAIASSLTELFSPVIIGERLDGMLQEL